MTQPVSQAPASYMDTCPKYDIALWETHATEDDYVAVAIPSIPLAKQQYFKCLNLLRSGEEVDEDEDEDFYIEDACDWLSTPFRPLIASLAPGTLNEAGGGLPTLGQYLFPRYFVCSLAATDEKLHANERASREHHWGSPLRLVGDDLLADLESWTRSFHPSQVHICYENPEDILIKPPRRVLVHGDDGSAMECFFKPFNLSFRQAHAQSELATHIRLAQAHILDLPQAFICRLYGIVRDGNSVAGMLFAWIENKGALSEERAEQSPVALRRRWATQISGTVQILHDRNIVWGDAKADNVLIDMNDDAWVIDFGGSYTLGWVDKEIAGTVDGDMQGLSKIMSILS
ncbi:kinase-like domain [Cordyceps militaris]|uniref:Kinase-like domain n=1 Tax=Cordyceps militaris TaxID=73501 RepID=A0A2H4S9I6_CORMI|nr:kinase-like domain [Cordyceps militaris]